MDCAFSPVDEMDFVKLTTPVVASENDQGIASYLCIQGTPQK